MKIIKLQAENIKKIKTIEITPDSNLIQITGANAQGKTSVLDSIWYALGGSKVIDDQPIRNGEDEAKITLELDNLSITRIFKRRGDSYSTSIFVKNKDGSKFSSPQCVLDQLVGSLSFDPLAFSRLKSKEQFNLLCKVSEINFDFDNYEADKKSIYEERTDINRGIKKIEAQLSDITIPSAPDVKIDVNDLNEKLQKAMEHNSKQDEYRRRIYDYDGTQTRIKKEIERLEMSKTAAKNAEQECADKIKDYIDINELSETIKASTSVNESVIERKNTLTRQQELKTRLKKGQLLSEEQTAALAGLEISKTTALTDAKMPIDELSVGDGDVFFNKIPLSQLSGAEQLKVSLAIAVATNPRLKVIRIADGSLLDKTSMDELLVFANANNFQIWIERVDESGEVGVCIEDGQIKVSKE